MDIVYSRGTATATEVLEQMPDEPNRATVRTLLRILEEKGHLSHSKKGREFVYVPSRPRERVGQSAFQRVLRTFFDGSLEKAVAAHLADPGSGLSTSDLERLSAMINAAKRKGKQK
ncbi:MAG: putative transcriptional regulator [Verrucomicrobiales bacterium]|nr:putative transcriptional regulator [Verrucomicrobiales bacterium]